MPKGEFDDYRNPASPDMISSPSPPWEGSGSATPLASAASSSSAVNFAPGQTVRLPPLPTIPASRTSTTPNSPTRARSTGDLLSEHESSRLFDGQSENDGHQNILALQHHAADSAIRLGPTLVDVVNGAREVHEEKKEEKKET